MATITLNGNPLRTSGELPTPGRATPPFTLTRTDLTEITSVDLEGKRVVLSIFPSLDTATCAESVRKFNELTSDLSDTVLLCVSMDLPFALGLFFGLNLFGVVQQGGRPGRAAIGKHRKRIKQWVKSPPVARSVARRKQEVDPLALSPVEVEAKPKPKRRKQS